MKRFDHLVLTLAIFFAIVVAYIVAELLAVAI